MLEVGVRVPVHANMLLHFLFVQNDMYEVADDRLV